MTAWWAASSISTVSTTQSFETCVSKHASDKGRVRGPFSRLTTAFFPVSGGHFLISTAHFTLLSPAVKSPFLKMGSATAVADPDLAALVQTGDLQVDIVQLPLAASLPVEQVGCRAELRHPAPLRCPAQLVPHDQAGW
jgi:hypothetical protein